MKKEFGFRFYFCLLMNHFFIVGCQNFGFEINPSEFEIQTSLNMHDDASSTPVQIDQNYNQENIQPRQRTPSVSLDTNPTKGFGGSSGYSRGQCGDGRAYQIYVPKSYQPSRAAALIVAMHGAGDTYSNFASVVLQTGWGLLSEQQGFIVMIPDHTNPTRRSFLHFNSNMSLNVAETQKEGRNLLDCIYYGVGSRYNIETHQIYWMGFSEGASFTAYMANFLSEQLRGVIIYGGSAPRLANVIKRKIPIYFISGIHDYNYNGILEQSATWSGHIHQRQFLNAGHSFVQLNSLVTPSHVWQWFQSHKVLESVRSDFR